MSHEWIRLRYVTWLLVRLGADDDALAIHDALVTAGIESPLNTAQLAALGHDPGDAT